MTSPSSRKFLLPLLLFGLVCPAVEHSATGPVSPMHATLPQQQPSWKVYRAPGVPFEFSYPDAFLLDAHVNPGLGFVFALMKQTGTPWLVDIGFEDRAGYSMEPYNKMSLEEFAIARAQVACQADGPEGSVSCPAVARKETFRNQKGVDVVEIYLNRVNEGYDPPKIEKSVIGPIEAVLLPTGRSGQVLTFKRTDNDKKGLVSDDLLRRMADLVSVRRWPDL
ncbi:MAG TPA: hypothetical protein VFJ52_02425 [Terriglobia bacterium]|nr:hypothetical protein [Terriglobia bacterium]